MEAWTNFFIRAGIPKDIASKYAKSFHNNRITKQMLPEIDKSTLSELGVSAIGDQLCILKRIKAAKISLEKNVEEEEDEEMDEEPAPKLKMASRVVKTQITGPESHSSSSSASTASEHRRGKPPPDRNEIYHVKMPVGNTHRTRQILQKAEKMRQQGLAVRGTTGVRQGGRSVSPIDKTSLAARMQKKQSSEVSSTSDHRRSHHQHQHGSGTTKISRIATSSIKKTITNRPTLSSRLTVGPSVSARDQQIRVTMNERPSRIEGRLQKTSTTSSGVVMTSGRGRGDRGQRQDVLLQYDDDEVEYEEDMEQVYADDQVIYEDEMEEVEEEEDVVTIPVHQRITYVSSGGGGRGTGQSSSQSSQSSFSRRVPISGPSGTSSGRPTTSGGVFSRVSYRR